MTAIPSRELFDSRPQDFIYEYETLPKNVKKYWRQRYSLFSKFDDGVYMNHELWFSVTPEDIAIFIAKFVQACHPELNTICDVFCGGGGNTIQFARRFNKVIGIDINEANLYCTERNCEVYGVKDKVELHLGSWIDLIGTEYYGKLQDEVDLVFASPPWGGPNYKNQEVFDLNYLEPMPIRELLVSFFKISTNVCLFLPRNSDVGQLAQITRELLGDEARCRVMYTYTEGYIKGIAAFWGEKFMPTTSTVVSETVETNGSSIYDEDFYDEKPIVKTNTTGGNSLIGGHLNQQTYGYDNLNYAQEPFYNYYQAYGYDNQGTGADYFESAEQQADDYYGEENQGEPQYYDNTEQNDEGYYEEDYEGDYYANGNEEDAYYYENTENAADYHGAQNTENAEYYYSEEKVNDYDPQYDTYNYDTYEQDEGGQYYENNHQVDHYQEEQEEESDDDDDDNKDVYFYDALESPLDKSLDIEDIIRKTSKRPLSEESTQRSPIANRFKRLRFR